MMNDNKKLTKLIDLCGRLPYGVIIEHNGDISKLDTIFMCDSISISSTSLDGEYLYNLDLDEFKPYLFPMSSMTEEQKSEYRSLCIEAADKYGDIVMYDTSESIDWLNTNHFDYRGLIPNGDAIDATNLNIYD